MKEGKVKAEGKIGMEHKPVKYTTSYKATTEWGKLHLHRRSGWEDILAIQAICTVKDKTRIVDFKKIDGSGEIPPVKYSKEVPYGKIVSLMYHPPILDSDSEIFIKASENGTILVTISWRASNPSPSFG